jgi:flagellin
LKEKVISAANDDKTDADRQAIQKELDQSIDQINDNANITYNGKYLVDGSHNNAVDKATTTAFTNQSMSTSMKGNVSFKDIKDRNENSINIQDKDTVQISFVKQGKTYTTSLQAAQYDKDGNKTGDNNMRDLVKAANLEMFKQQVIAQGVDLSTKADGTASEGLTAWRTFVNSYNTAADKWVKAEEDVDDAANLEAKNTKRKDADKAKETFQKELDTARDTLATAVKVDKGDLKFKAAIDMRMDSDTYIGKDKAGDSVYTADRANGLSLHSAASGVSNQISGITLSVSNTKGAVQKSINAVLDNFSETIRAENKSKDNAITLQVGTKANQSIRVGLTDMRAEALGLQSSTGDTLNVTTQKNANAAINVLDNALQKALDQQTTIGSIESRLEYTSTNLTTSSQNVQASESTIRDADMAKEMTNYTKNNVLLQAAQSMLAQANQSSSSVLSLLQ